jgi:hypothetical protein
MDQEKELVPTKDVEDVKLLKVKDKVEIDN